MQGLLSPLSREAAEQSLCLGRTKPSSSSGKGKWSGIVGLAASQPWPGSTAAPPCQSTENPAQSPAQHLHPTQQTWLQTCHMLQGHHEPEGCHKDCKTRHPQSIHPPGCSPAPAPAAPQALKHIPAGISSLPGHSEPSWLLPMLPPAQVSLGWWSRF